MNLDTWYIFPFQGQSDYWAGINTDIDSEGLVTVDKDGVYYIVCHIPLSIDETEDAITQWKARICYSSPNGTIILNEQFQEFIYNPLLPPTPVADCSGTTELREGDTVWVEVMAKVINGDATELTAGGDNSYFMGTRGGD